MKNRQNSDLIVAEQVLNHYKGKHKDNELIKKLNLDTVLIDEIISYDKLYEPKSIKIFKDAFDNISFYKNNHYKYKEVLGANFEGFLIKTIEIKPLIAMTFLNYVYNNTDKYIEFYFALLYLKSSYEDFYQKNIELINEIDVNNPINSIDRLISDGDMDIYIAKNNKLLKINSYKEIKSSKSIFYFDDSKSKLVKQSINKLAYIFYDYSKQELKDIRIKKLHKRIIQRIPHIDLPKFYETNFSDNLINIITNKKKHGHYSEFQVNIINEVYSILDKNLSIENNYILDSITGFFCAYMGVINIEKEELSELYTGYDIKNVRNKIKYIVEHIEL